MKKVHALFSKLSFSAWGKNMISEMKKITYPVGQFFSEFWLMIFMRFQTCIAQKIWIRFWKISIKMYKLFWVPLWYPVSVHVPWRGAMQALLHVYIIITRSVWAILGTMILPKIFLFWKSDIQTFQMWIRNYSIYSRWVGNVHLKIHDFLRYSSVQA